MLLLLNAIRRTRHSLRLLIAPRRYSSNYSSDRKSAANSYYLEQQKRDLLPLNKLLLLRAMGFEDKLCCTKPPLMKTITAYNPHYKCMETFCKL